MGVRVASVFFPEWSPDRTIPTNKEMRKYKVSRTQRDFEEDAGN